MYAAKITFDIKWYSKVLRAKYYKKVTVMLVRLVLYNESNVRKPEPLGMKSKEPKRRIRWGHVSHLSRRMSKAGETETAEKLQVWRAGMKHTQSLFVELNKHRSGLPSDQCLETKATLSRLVKCGVEVLDCWCWEPGIETGGVTAGERWNLNRALLECNQIHRIRFTRLICQLCSDICGSAWVNKTLLRNSRLS